MKSLVKSFVTDESGATAIESVGIIGAAKSLGNQVSGTFNNVATAMKNA